MPRTLPWLAEPKEKSKEPPSTSPSGAPKRKRDATPPSDQDLVDADLNPTGVSTPQRRKKQQHRLNLERSPSTSPPPAPPSVEYMRPGKGADDAWMMVEDEFLATAQLFTQHLHHAAYAEQKRRAQARGEKVLRTLARPTDGRTERDSMVVEREQNEKGIKQALGWDKEEDLEDLTDPLLGALMNDSRKMGRALEVVGKVKSRSRAANGFGKSPEKIRRRNMELDGGGEDFSDHAASEADSDDLDGPAAAPAPRHQGKDKSSNRNHTSKPIDRDIGPRRQTEVFKKFASVASENAHQSRHKPGQPPARDQTVNERNKPDSDARHPNGNHRNNPFITSIDDLEYTKPSAREEPPSYLVKRRQRKEEEEKRKAKESKAAVEVPTFMF